jgi:hypothetical protein
MTCPNRIEAAKLQSAAWKKVEKSALYIFIIPMTRKGKKIKRYSDSKINKAF